MTIYRKLPFEHEFSDHFVEQGFEQFINYDNKQTFMIYRVRTGTDFFAFPLGTNYDLKKSPKKWDLGDDLDIIENEEITFLRDLSLKLLENKNNLILFYDRNKIKKISFNDRLGLIKSRNFILKRDYKPKRVLYHKSIIYLLEDKILTEIKIQGKKMVYKETKLQREYNDMAITRENIFLFIRGYSDLLASPLPRPESPKTKEVEKNFRHGSFIYAGFSNFLLKKSQHESGSFEYFYLEKIDDQIIVGLKKIPGLTGDENQKVRLLETKNQIYYLYPNSKKDQFEIFYKGGYEKVKLKGKLHGKVLGVSTGYTSGLTATFPIVYKSHMKKDKRRSILDKAILGRLSSKVKISPLPVDEDEGKQLEAIVKTIGASFKIKINFAKPDWKKGQHLSPIITIHKDPSSYTKLDEEKLDWGQVIMAAVTIFGIMFFTITCFIYVTKRKILKEKFKAHDMINEIDKKKAEAMAEDLDKTNRSSNTSFGVETEMSSQDMSVSETYYDESIAEK